MQALVKPQPELASPLGWRSLNLRRSGRRVASAYESGPTSAGFGPCGARFSREKENDYATSTHFGLCNVAHAGPRNGTRPLQRR
jgi:hypothetical protein